MTDFLPPVIILSGHRTGSSAVAAMLVACGLHVGETIPPTRDNPRGYFENAGVLEASRRMLARRSRDWTCPPEDLIPTELDQIEAAEAIEALRMPERAWGFKDPRTLFLLPAWLEVLPEMVFIGVTRPVEAVAASIERRDGFPHDDALRIAEAYEGRLRQLERELRFPVIDFLDDPTQVGRAVEVAVRGIEGLVWSAEEAVAALDPGLVHHVTGVPARDGSDADSGVVTSPEVRRAWNRMVPDRAELSRSLGPAYRSRQRDVQNLATQVRPGVGTVLEIGHHDDSPPIGVGLATEVMPPEELLRSVGTKATYSHVVAVDLLENTPPDRLTETLLALAEVTDADGVAVLGALLVDGAINPEALRFPGLALTAHRDALPYLHHRTLLEAALVAGPWRLGGILDSDNGWSRIVLAKSEARIRPDTTEAFALRAAQPEVEEELRTLRRELRRLEQLRVVSEEAGRRSAQSIEQLTDQLAAATSNLEAAVADATEQQIRLARLTDARKATEEALAAAERERDIAADQATATQAQHDSLANRRSVRAALRLAALARPFFRFVRRDRSRVAPIADLPTSETVVEDVPDVRLTAKPKRPTFRPAPAQAERKTAAAICTLRPDAGPEEGPLVSIVVLTRDGAPHLRRLFSGLRDRTNYRSFEVVVVDNGSTDDTADVLAEPWGFPVRHVRNQTNTSFSDGCNQGFTHAEGDLVLLLNNDVDPINNGWLGAMVRALERNSGFGAIGSLLVYPRVGPSHTPPLTIQHCGIRFAWEDGVPRARNQGRGEDPTAADLVGTATVPAATAACLLVERAVYDDVGGMSEGYVYGTEDVDFCLKIQSAGWDVGVCRDAALFHHESSTQDDLVRDLVRINRMGNARSFAEQWMSQLDREMRLDTFRPERCWLESAARTIAITLTRDHPAAGWGDWYTAHELGDALGELGWQVYYAERHEEHWYDLPEDVAIVISLLDAFDVSRVPAGVYTIAWIRNWVDRWVEHPWIDDYDLVLGSSDITMDIVRNRSQHIPRKLPIATNPERFRPQPYNPTFDSDYIFTGNYWGVGRELMTQLEIRPEERFFIFGAGWDEYPRAQRYWRGALAYELLPDAYSSTKIVLDDTAGPTKPYGAVNSRVFDALAAGALVLTDNEIGAAELFEGALPSFGSRQELRELLDTYLSDDELRRSTARQLRQMVLDRYTYDRAATTIIQAAEAQIMEPRVAIKIGPPNWDVAEQWGDTHFARQFASALRRQGFATDIDILPEWDRRDKQAADVVVHLRGLVPYVPKPSQVNVLWVISHPDDVTAGECDQYDLVLVASDIHAARLRNEVKVPVHTMFQATDPDRFTPTEPAPELAAQLLFVGNSRRQEREAVAWAAEADLPLVIHGADWDELIDPRFVRGGFFPNERLNELYCAAEIVLNDHWPDMRDGGLISNRIFDALACGAFVISDAVAGMDELFGDAVPTFSSRTELEDVVSYYLDRPEERRLLATKGMETVRSEHTFDARAAAFRELVEPFLTQRRWTVTSTGGAGSKR